MSNVRIADVRKIVNPGGPRVGQIDTLVTYQTEDGNMFLITIPKAEPKDEEIQAGIKADLTQRSRLVGKTFSVA
ncbi:MAG: hypothetical protein ACREJ6_02125 [Candidatus Methylomirabilis sp.]